VLGSCAAGDVKLSALRAALAEAGVAAEFAAGGLVCSGRVSVRREPGQGEVRLEGPLSADYYKVRDVLYAQYHVC
jgi:cleavage and polyadenylation specificity factor subunit 2